MDVSPGGSVVGVMALSGEQRVEAQDDDALLSAARADLAAFDALYERYRHRVFAYLRTRTVSEDDAADLTQQVFLRALDGLRRYRGHGDRFAAWLFRIARNAATDYYRRRRPSVTWDLLPEALQPSSDVDLAAAVEHHEALIRLRHALLTLSAEQRELLALHYAGRLTAREIGTVMGKSEAAAKKQLWRTLQTLKERYYAP